LKRKWIFHIREKRKISENFREISFRETFRFRQFYRENFRICVTFQKPFRESKKTKIFVSTLEQGEIVGGGGRGHEI
jgi:hypothetical protein